MQHITIENISETTIVLRMNRELKKLSVLHEKLSILYFAWSCQTFTFQSPSDYSIQFSFLKNNATRISSLSIYSLILYIKKRQTQRYTVQHWQKQRNRWSSFVNHKVPTWSNLPGLGRNIQLPLTFDGPVAKFISNYSS